MVLELKKGYTIESNYDKFTDSYITRLLDENGKQVRDALYSPDINGRNYDIQDIRDFFQNYMGDPNFNPEPITDFENEDSISEQPVDSDEPEEELTDEEPIEEAFDPEIERKARKTKRATRKAKLPALSTMTPIMPDYASGISKFNAMQPDGNSGMMSTTGSTSLGEEYLDRDTLIHRLKDMGFKYNFDKYSDRALSRIYQARMKKTNDEKEAEASDKEHLGESMETKFYLNDLHEAWDIEDDYSELQEAVLDDTERKPLTESLLKEAKTVDHKFKTLNEGFKYFNQKAFNEQAKDIGCDLIFESMRDKLSSEDVKKLGAFMNHAQDPDEVITYMKGLLTKDKDLKKLKENLTESYQSDSDIVNTALQNGFINDVVDYLTDSKFEQDQNGKWCYMRPDRSGRDFFQDVPLQYMSEDEVENLVQYIIEDCGLEDYDWGSYDAYEAEEMLYEDSWSLIDAIEQSLPSGALSEGLNESIYPVEYTYTHETDESRESRLGHLNVEADSEEAALWRAEDYLNSPEFGNTHYQDYNPCRLKIGDTTYTNVDTLLADGSVTRNDTLKDDSPSAEEMAQTYLLDELGDIGYVLDSSLPEPVKKNLFGGKHIQIVKPGSQTSEETFREDIQDLLEVLEDLENRFEGIFTYNIGANQNFEITAGIDIKE